MWSARTLLTPNRAEKDMKNGWMHTHTHTQRKGLGVTDLWPFLLIKNLVQYRTDFLGKD